MSDIMLRRMAMMAVNESGPVDLTAWVNGGNGTVTVNEQYFTVKYTSAGRGVWREISLSNPISVKAGDVFQIYAYDAWGGNLKAKGTELNEKYMSRTTSWTVEVAASISKISFATTVASGTQWSSRFLIKLNGVVILGNNFG